MFNEMVKVSNTLDMQHMIGNSIIQIKYDSENGIILEQ